MCTVLAILVSWSVMMRYALYNVITHLALAVRADNVPSACMDLATVILNDPTQEGGPIPTPLGSASLQYTGLTDKDKADLQNALSKVGTNT